MKVRKSLLGGWRFPGADVDATIMMGSALEAIEVGGAAKGAKMGSVFTPQSRFGTIYSNGALPKLGQALQPSCILIRL